MKKFFQEFKEFALKGSILLSLLSSAALSRTS